MDGKVLAKAAVTGNVDQLERLIREDMLVLDRIVLLVKAGAKSGKDNENENEAGRTGQSLKVEIVHETHVPPRNCTDEESNLPKTTKEYEELFAYKPKRDSINDVRNLLLTVAALMITATYQAVISPPGGVWQEDSQEHSAGASILATKSRGIFWFFVLGNSIGYFTSFYIINVLTSGFPLRYPLQLLILSMSFNYGTSVANLLHSDRISNLLLLLLCTMSGGIAPYVPGMLRRLHFRAQK